MPRHSFIQKMCIRDRNSEPALRYTLLAKAAEYVFISTQELQTANKQGKSVQKVSFKTYFLKTVKRMRAAYDICQPSGELGEEESALAQCFMAIAGFVRKMSGTSEVDTDTMNRRVAKMVEEALKYNKVESVFEDGEQEVIFSPEYFEKLSDVKMPASKLELLVKMLRKQIKEYSKTNQMAAKKFQEMLEETIKQYHERRKHLTAEEAGEAQEQTADEIIKYATEPVSYTPLDVYKRQVLGYVNNLVEQDGVKVLLVANEDEIIRYKPIDAKNKEEQKTA